MKSVRTIVQAARTLARSRAALRVASLVSLASLGALTMATHGCGEPEQVSQRSDQLTTATWVTFWTQNAHKLPLCFVTTQRFPIAPLSKKDQLEFRQGFRFAVERAWPAVAWLDVSGFNDCPTVGSTRYVRYGILAGGGGAAQLGMADFPLPTDPSQMMPEWGTSRPSEASLTTRA